MKKLNDKTILLAAAGEPEAMEEVVKAFNSYINALATDKRHGSSGRVYRYVNSDRKSFIFLEVIKATLNWRPKK